MLILGSIKKCAAAVDKKATQFANTAKQVLSKYKLSPKSKVGYRLELAQFSFANPRLTSFAS